MPGGASALAGRPRALVISRKFPPAFSAEAIVTGKFVAALTSAGVPCEVVCASPHGRTDASACWDELLPQAHFLDDSPRRLVRLLGRTAAHLRTRYFGDISGWTLRAEKSCRQLIEQQPFDLILTRTLSEDALVVGYDLWRRTGLPWVAYLGDPPRGLFPPPYRSAPHSWRNRHTVAWLRRVLPQVPMIMFPCRRLADYYRDALGVALGDNVAIIPHIGWRSSAPPLAERQRGPLRLMHLGHLGRRRSPVECLAALGRALNGSPANSRPVEVLFVGVQDPGIIAALNGRQFPFALRFLPPVSYEESLRLMAGADALLLIEATLQEGIFLPSKFCDYAASGRPVLMYCPDVGTVADIVGRDLHPGFMGQTGAGAEAAFQRFLAAAEDPVKLADFHIHAPDFQAERVIDRFIREVQARLGAWRNR